MPAGRRPLTSFAHAAAVAACTLVATHPIHAQQVASAPPPGPQFLSRYDFRMYAAALAHEDPRFTWDTHWVGDFDLVDYVVGRMSFLADYQALLGEEFRPFDPYQSNYTLAVSGSVRLRGAELVGVFHHLSRHLGDRPKRDSVAMNAVIGRLLSHFERPRTSIDVRVEAGRVVARALTDYTWIGGGDLVVRRTMTGRTALDRRAGGDIYGVDPDYAGRDTQLGGRLEAGVRLRGEAGAIDLFGGYERVVDADPLDMLPREWAFAGFRLLRN